MCSSDLRRVSWCRVIAAAEHKNGQTEHNTFWDAQPVQIMQQRCNMVSCGHLKSDDSFNEGALVAVK